MTMFAKTDDWKTYPSTISESQIRALAKECASFTIQAKGSVDLMELSSMLDRVIESAGFKTRVYTKGRATGLLAGPAAPWIAVGIGVHNLLTWDPDYEIRRNLLTDTLDVVYMRKS
jgi:hypothetical protein